MALNVCPLDYLISRTGNVILFLLLHNTQRECEAVLMAGALWEVTPPLSPTLSKIFGLQSCAWQLMALLRFVCMQFRKVLCVHSGYSASSGV